MENKDIIDESLLNNNTPLSQILPSNDENVDKYKCVNYINNEKKAEEENAVNDEIIKNYFKIEYNEILEETWTNITKLNILLFRYLNENDFIKLLLVNKNYYKTSIQQLSTKLNEKLKISNDVMIKLKEVNYIIN